MTIFRDAKELEEVLGGFFETLRFVEQAYLVDQIGGSVEFLFHRPDTRITWVLEEGADTEAPFRVAIGPMAEPPLLTFEQDGDTAHRFWLGRVDLQQALARQQVKARGPLSRAMKLIPHLDTIYPLYRTYLENLGRPDLLGGRP
jgi:hypothetical protein